jgi:hypothetical protein
MFMLLQWIQKQRALMGRQALWRDAGSRLYTNRMPTFFIFMIQMVTEKCEPVPVTLSRAR